MLPRSFRAFSLAMAGSWLLVLAGWSHLELSSASPLELRRTQMEQLQNMFLFWSSATTLWKPTFGNLLGTYAVVEYWTWNTFASCFLNRSPHSIVLSKFNLSLAHLNGLLPQRVAGNYRCASTSSLQWSLRGATATSLQSFHPEEMLNFSNICVLADE